MELSSQVCRCNCAFLGHVLYPARDNEDKEGWIKHRHLVLCDPSVFDPCPSHGQLCGGSRCQLQNNINLSPCRRLRSFDPVAAPLRVYCPSRIATPGDYQVDSGLLPGLSHSDHWYSEHVLCHARGLH